MGDPSWTWWNCRGHPNEAGFKGLEMKQPLLHVVAGAVYYRAAAVPARTTPDVVKLAAAAVVCSIPFSRRSSMTAKAVVVYHF